MNKNMLDAGFYFEFDKEIKQSSGNKDIINRIMCLKEEYPDVQESLIKAQRYLTTERNTYQTKILPCMSSVRSLLENIYDGNIGDMAVRYKLLNIEKIERGIDAKRFARKIVDCLKISEELKALEPGINNFVQDVFNLGFFSVEGKERIKKQIDMSLPSSSTSFDIASVYVPTLLPLLRQMLEQSTITEEVKQSIRQEVKKDISGIVSDMGMVIRDRNTIEGRKLAKKLGMDIDKEETLMANIAKRSFGFDLGIYNRNTSNTFDLQGMLDKLLWDNLNRALDHLSKNMDNIIEKESKAGIERAYSKQNSIKPKIEKLLNLGKTVEKLNKRMDELGVRSDVVNCMNLRDVYCGYHNDYKCTEKNCALEKLESGLNKVKYHIFLTIF